MHSQFIEKAEQLNKGREAYATAIIVQRQIPSSGKPGDKAIITADGSIHGWIGGGCTKGIVLKEALLAIKEAKPRYVSITPDGKATATKNIKLYKMTCQSGGSVDIYIEPVLPKAQLVIFGKSHIAMALSRIAHAMDYQVVCVGDNLDKIEFPDASSLIPLNGFANNLLNDNSFIVVCTQGEGDVDSLEKAILSNNHFISFVASRKKANAIFKDLRSRGITFDQLKKIKTPAGIDINAKLPEEVAISILAEVISELRNESDQENLQEVQINNDDFYMNPVCNIPIQKSSAKHVLIHEGENVYFCCDGCKVKFEAEPSLYA